VEAGSDRPRGTSNVRPATEILEVDHHGDPAEVGASALRPPSGSSSDRLLAAGAAGAEDRSGAEQRGNDQQSGPEATGGLRAVHRIARRPERRSRPAATAAAPATTSASANETSARADRPVKASITGVDRTSVAAATSDGPGPEGSPNATASEVSGSVVEVPTTDVVVLLGVLLVVVLLTVVLLVVVLVTVVVGTVSTGGSLGASARPSWWSAGTSNASAA
jgi:hypothetical protein